MGGPEAIFLSTEDAILNFSWFRPAVGSAPGVSTLLPPPPPPKSSDILSVSGQVIEGGLVAF